MDFVVPEVVWHGLGWQDTLIHTLSHWSMPYVLWRPSVSLLEPWHHNIWALFHPSRAWHHTFRVYLIYILFWHFVEANEGVASTYFMSLTNYVHKLCWGCLIKKCKPHFHLISSLLTFVICTSETFHAFGVTRYFLLIHYAWRLNCGWNLLILDVNLCKLGFYIMVSWWSKWFLCNLSLCYYSIMFHGKNFYFMVDILLGEIIREEHTCFFPSQGNFCPKFVKEFLLGLDS
jgi:hypothetical protein